MKHFFSLIIFLASFLSFAGNYENTNPLREVDTGIKPWEYFAIENTSPDAYRPSFKKGDDTSEKLLSLKNSFIGDDPLLCVEDKRWRDHMRTVFSRYPDGETQARRIALAHYYSLHYPEKTDYIFENPDIAINEFEGKPADIDFVFEALSAWVKKNDALPKDMEEHKKCIAEHEKLLSEKREKTSLCFLMGSLIFVLIIAILYVLFSLTKKEKEKKRILDEYIRYKKNTEEQTKDSSPKETISSNHLIDAAKAPSCRSSGLTPFKKTKSVFICLTDFQKLSLCASIVSVILLVISVWAIEERENLGGGYYVFLRIIVCAAMVCLCFERLSIWWKFFLILQAVLYNPIIQIHLKDRDDWLIFDGTAIVFLLISYGYILVSAKKRLDRNGNSDNDSAETR